MGLEIKIDFHGILENIESTVALAVNGDMKIQRFGSMVKGWSLPGVKIGLCHVNQSIQRVQSVDTS